MTSIQPRQGLIATALLMLILVAGCGEKPQAMLDSAKIYLSKNDNKGAIIQIKNALQNNPDLPEARYLLGRVLLEDGDAIGAETELRKALDLKYPKDIVVPQLAKSLLAQGQGKKLTDEFSNVELGQAEASASFKMSLASAYSMQGKPELSQEALNAALVAAPGYPPALLEQARQMAEQRNFDGALALADEVLAKAPNSHEAWKLKGDIYLYAQNRVAEALAAYRQAVKIKPDFLPGQAAVIAVLLRQGDAAQATVQLEQLKKFAPNHLQTKYLEAQLAFQKKDFKLAREVVQQLLKVEPKNIQALQLAGAVELQLNALPQAQAYLRQALATAPWLLLSRRLLVMTYLRSGQANQALETLLPALDEKRIDPELFSLAGEVYLQTGDVQKAQSYFKKAVDQAPNDGNKQTSLALMHMMSGSVDSAFEELRDIAVSDKGTRADLALVSAYLSRKEFDQALKAIDGLEKKQPTQPLAAYLRARTLLAKNDAIGARKSFEKALAINPNYFPAVTGLATLDLAEKKPNDARKRFEAVLEKDPKNSLALLALAELAANAGAGKVEVSRLLGNAVAANPVDPAARLMLIDYLLRNQDLKGASSAAENAVAAIPENAAILDALGRTQQASGELNQAITTYNKLATMAPHMPQPYLRLADVHMADKNADAAISSLRKALEIQPDLLVAQRGLISLELNRKDVPAALALARTVQKQRPKESVGYVLEGDVHASQQSWDSAAGTYRAGLKQVQASELAIKLHAALVSSGKSAEAQGFSATWQKEHPGDALFLFYLGDEALARKDFAGAEKVYAAITRVQPNNAVAYNNLAWVSARLNRDGALRYAEKANALLPNQPAFMDTLAMLLSEKGDYEKALDLQNKVLALQPLNPQFKLNLAKIHLKAGKKELARKPLEELNKMGDKFPGQLEVATLLKGL